MFENDSRSSLRKWIFAALLAAAGVLLSPVFSFPLGVTRAFPLQHMINIFLAVLCGTRYGVSAAFTTSVIRNIIGSGSLLAFPGSMIGAFLSGYLYSRTKKLWAAVLGEFAGTSLIGGLVSYPLAALFMGSSKGAFFYISLFRFLRRRVPHCFHRPQRDPYLSNKYDKRKIIFLSKLTFRGLQASFFLHKNDGCTLTIYDLYVQLTSGVKTIDSFYFHQI